MSNIGICIWLDDQAEEAAKFYTAIFPNSKIKETARYPESAEKVSGKQAGSVMTVSLEIDGLDVLLLNGGPQFKPSEAMSFMITRDTQEELDDIWYKLTADGGSEGPCGWCKDKFGVSWQVTPTGMGEIMGAGGNKEKANKAMAAMLNMKKIDISKLKEAAA
jgi:predicted 3-demethylubiquinone-9 3-methyltransferase (glyoxalase superfamily)